MWAAVRFAMSIAIGAGLFAEEKVGGHTITADFPTPGASSIKICSRITGCQLFNRRQYLLVAHITSVYGYIYTKRIFEYTHMNYARSRSAVVGARQGGQRPLAQRLVVPLFDEGSNGT